MFLKLELREEKSASHELSALARWLCGGLIALFIGALIVAILHGQSTKAAANLAASAQAALAKSGVSNPVTAVLLNFRSFDTLLEVAVLLLVAVAMLPPLAQSGAQTRLMIVHQHRVVHPVLAGLLRWLVPLAMLLSGYLLWTGAYAPGGAFQAGAVLAGAGVALALGGRHEFLWHGNKARWLLSVGLVIFILVAASCVITMGTVLQYPQDQAAGLILLIEVAATLSITAILLLLFTRLLQIDQTITEGDQR